MLGSRIIDLIGERLILIILGILSMFLCFVSFVLWALFFLWNVFVFNRLIIYYKVKIKKIKVEKGDLIIDVGVLLD
jgi:membrane protein YdbS with pleckstrin-like domain